MNLGSALLLWLVLVVGVYLLARHLTIRPWSALIAALLAALIVLLIVRPMSVLDVGLTGGEWTMGAYALILFATPILAVIYIFSMVIKDRDTAARSPVSIAY